MRNFKVFLDGEYHVELEIDAINVGMLEDKVEQEIQDFDSEWFKDKAKLGIPEFIEYEEIK